MDFVLTRMQRTTTAFLISLLLGVTAIPSHAQNALNVGLDDLVDRLTASTPAEVAGVEGETIYLSVGEEESVSEGDEFDVVRPGEVLAAGGKVLQKERPVGEIRITKVRKGASLARIITAYAQMQKGDRAYPRRKKPGRLALAEFPYRESFNECTRNVYEGLATRLVQKGFQLLERAQLERVLQEQDLSHSGIVDLTTAQKLGKLVGAETMLLGSITDLGNQLTIHARLVDVEKGIAMKAAEVGVVKSPEIAALLEIKAGGQQPGGPASQPAKKTGAGGQDLAFENELIRIEVLSFTREAQGLVLKLRYLNKLKAPLNMQLQNKKSNTWLVDEAGHHYPFKSTDMGFWYQDIAVLPDVPRSAAIVFSDEGKNGRQFTFSAEYGWNSGSGGGIRLPFARSSFFATIRQLKLP